MQTNINTYYDSYFSPIQTVYIGLSLDFFPLTMCLRDLFKSECKDYLISFFWHLCAFFSSCTVCHYRTWIMTDKTNENCAMFYYFCALENSGFSL